MPSPRPLPSLRTELLVTIGVLAAAAVLIAVVTLLLATDIVERPWAALWISALVVADVLVIVAFGAYQLQRLVLGPLGDVAAAAEAIAGGDLARRVPAGGSAELAALAASVNRMTDHLLAEQAGRTRVEKMATVGRLAAGVAHEIGNPLGAINGYTHILRGHVSGDGGLDALEGLERESARIDRIVRGLLDYARPRRPTPVALDLNDVVRGAVGLLEDQGVLRRLTTRLDLDAGAPRLVGERHEVEQVLVNLLLNAVDAVSGAGELAIVTRRTTAEALLAAAPRRAGDPADRDYAHVPSTGARAWLERAGPVAGVAQVVVADSGSGVAADDAERIFDPFFTTKEPGRGTGLGLAIVARIVESFGGTIWVQKAREGGAAFVMLFPLADEAAPVGSAGVRRPAASPRPAHMVTPT